MFQLRRGLAAASATGAAVLAMTFAPHAAPAGGTPATCFGQSATITSDKDFVPGTPGDDVIITGAAANSVYADAGNDRVCTGDGKDFVRGDLGDDMISTGPKADKVSGGDLDPADPSGNDTINGGGGPDELNGHDGNDILRGGPGDDILRGGPGYDICYPGTGTDTVRGCEEVH